MNTPDINEFIAHPDYQQIASFFLGTVFVTSLNYSYLWIRGFFPRIWSRIFGKHPTSNDTENSASEKSYGTSSTKFVRPGENSSLVFTLSLCFVFTSMAYFGSLLSYNPNGGAICAFVVAWGGMAAQTARIIGLVIILFELRDLGIARLELYLTFTCLFIAMVLVFVNNAIGTGAIRLFRPLGIAICYRKHFILTALATSLVNILIELFMLFRLTILIVRQSIPSQRLAAWKDGRVVKALSLLFLELLTIGPSATHISLLADFIPLSIGALAVLVAFNSGPTTQSRSVLDPIAASPLSAPQVARTGWLRRSFGYSSNRSNMVSTPVSPQPVPAIIPHPFSSQYLNDTDVAWPRQDQHTSRLSTAGTVMSTHEAIVQTAERSGAPTRARAVATTLAAGSRVSERISQQPFDVPPVSKTSAVDAPVTEAQTPAPVASLESPVVSPTSLLMHPWHERLQRGNTRLTSRFSADGSEEFKHSKWPSSKASDRSSYIFRGYAFPRPPASPPPGPMRRYSSATLTSPLFSQEGGDSRQSGHVKLVTFESTFRTTGEKVSYRTPLPSASTSSTPHG